MEGDTTDALFLRGGWGFCWEVSARKRAPHCRVLLLLSSSRQRAAWKCWCVYVGFVCMWVLKDAVCVLVVCAGNRGGEGSANFRGREGGRLEKGKKEGKDASEREPHGPSFALVVAR